MFSLSEQVFCECSGFTAGTKLCLWPEMLGYALHRCAPTQDMFIVTDG